MKTSIKPAVVKMERMSTKRSDSVKSPLNKAPFPVRSSAEWTTVQGEHVLDLFKKAAQHVPAYKNFLKSNKIKAENITSVSDFSTVPPVNKNNYLRANSFKELLWNGTTKTPHVLTSTSGSTGKPFYFGRSSEIDENSSLIHEMFFDNSSLDSSKSTLVIVCFSMGIWIGGLITYQAYELLARRKGYPISIVTPGINKAEILKVLRDHAPHYDQIILAGYPPFLKDVIDEAVAENISFKKYTVLLQFAAEAFTEQFRDHIAKKVGVKNVLTDTANFYGSADIGTMGFETPISILIRRLATKKESLFRDLFNGTMKTPTLAQFMPEFVSFEAPNGEIILTGNNILPLIRYSIGDHGGVYTYREIEERCKAHGINLKEEIKKAGISNLVQELPFVYVYERIDLSTTLYGLQIYPETIKEVLLDKRFHEILTGKLSLITKYDHNQDQYLEINLEQKPGKEASRVLAAELVAEISKNLREKNSEYRELSSFLGKRAEPTLVFWHYEDPLYFKPGVKQQWVVRTT